METELHKKFTIGTNDIIYEACVSGQWTKNIQLKKVSKPLLAQSSGLMAFNEYIHTNPVKAGFVEEPWQWKYRSAIDYSGKKGLINICFL